MVEINGEKYLDGGVSDSIPLRRLVEQGNEKNVVVLTQPRDYEKGANKLVSLFKHKYRDYPNLISSMANRHIMYNETLNFIREQEKQGKAFVIAPPEKLIVDKIEKDRAKLEAVYNIGREEALKRIEELKEFIKT